MPNYQEISNPYNGFFERPLIPSGSEAGVPSAGLSAVAGGGGGKASPLDMANGVAKGAIKPKELDFRSNTVALVFKFGDGSDANTVQAGMQCHFEVPFDCEIVRGSLTALPDTADGIVDIWVDKFDNHAPTDADSITGGSPLTISSGGKYENAGLSDWETFIPKGSVILANIDSQNSCKALTAELEVRKKS